MTTPRDKTLHPSDTRPERKPYEKPTLTRVDLSLEETLASGCKMTTDFRCIGPPTPSFDSGS